MITATLQGLLGRKLRTALTALSIILGVAMVSGTFVLTDTMKKAFNDLFQGTYKDTGAVISGKEIVTGASKSTVPESLKAKVTALSDVKSASGAIFDISGTSDFVKLIGRNGKQLGSEQQPNFGWGFDPGQPHHAQVRQVGGRPRSSGDRRRQREEGALQAGRQDRRRR